jgi:antiviral helicase SLH1
MSYTVLLTGLTHEDPVNDPNLTEHSHGIIIRGARALAKVGMVQFDEVNSKFAITDVGRIAAKYYIHHASIEIFQKEFKPRMTEADVLALLSMSTEVSAMGSPLHIHQTPASLTKSKCEKMKLRNSKS